MKTAFDMTNEGFEQATEYLKSVGKLEKFYQNSESTDGFSLIYYANYLRHKSQRKNMPDLSELLTDQIADEIEDVIVPEGYWNGTIKGGKIKDNNADEEPYTDKNGDEFVLVFIYIQCDTPAEGVDPTEAKVYEDADGPSETIATYRAFVYGKKDVRKLTHTLKMAGVPTAGKSFVDIINVLKKTDVPVKVLIEHEEYRDEMQANVTELLPS